MTSRKIPREPDAEIFELVSLEAKKTDPRLGGGLPVSFSCWKIMTAALEKLTLELS